MTHARFQNGALRALVAFATIAVAACTYDFDLEGLAPPLDAGSGQGGAAGTPKLDASAGTAGKSGAAGGRADAGSGSREGGDGTAGASGTGSGGSGGSGGAGAMGGTAGSSGAGGASGSGGSGASGGAGGATIDASTDGAGGSGARGGNAGTGGAGTAGAGGGSGTAGTGGTGTGGTGTGGAGTGGAGTGGTAGTGTAGAGTGGSGTGGAGTGGTAGARPDAGSTRDVRVDTAADASTPPFDCASVGGTTYEDHCYYAVMTPVTWEVAAKQTCASPAHLVTITSAGEHTFVSSILSGQSRWIGLYRPTGSPQTPSGYEWITGEAVAIMRWYSSNGEPDFDGQCVRIGSPNLWGDHPCGTEFPVICERE